MIAPRAHMTERHERVIDALARNQITQEIVAAVADCSQSFVSRVLRGEKTSARVFRAAESLLNAGKDR